MKCFIYFIPACLGMCFLGWLDRNRWRHSSTSVGPEQDRVVTQIFLFVYNVHICNKVHLRTYCYVLGVTCRLDFLLTTSGGWQLPIFISTILFWGLTNTRAYVQEHMYKSICCIFIVFTFLQLMETNLKSNFVTCAKYNKCRLYHEMLTYKPLTNSVVQEELRKYLPSRLK